MTVSLQLDAGTPYPPTLGVSAVRCPGTMQRKRFLLFRGGDSQSAPLKIRGTPDVGSTILWRGQCFRWCTGRPSSPPLSLSSGKPWKPCQALLQLPREGSAGGTKGQKTKEAPRCILSAFYSIVPWLWDDDGLLARSSPPSLVFSPPFFLVPCYIACMPDCQIVYMCICVYVYMYM